MTLLKKCLPDVLAVLLFAVLAFAYFFPADIEGRILYRHDASAGRGAGQEGVEYKEKTGERSRWTNALFGGMPTYQMAPSYHSTDNMSQAIKAYHLWLPENVSPHRHLHRPHGNETGAKMSPAMAGFNPFRVLVISALFFLLMKSFKIKYTMMTEGRQSANEANSEPPKPAVV